MDQTQTIFVLKLQRRVGYIIAMLCMTLLVRNEEPILETNIEYHLSRGVDFIIATDNRSTDATSDILREYERLGVLRYVFEPQDDYSQDLWVTRMARMAATDHKADWIIHVDADEFWWPERNQSIADALEQIPMDADGIRVDRSNFIRTMDMDEAVPFVAAMTIRDLESENPLGKPLPGKIAHRASDQAVIHQGNHEFHVEGRPATVHHSSDLVIFHYPLRDFPSFQRRIAEGGAAYERNNRLDQNVGITWRHLYQKLKDGTLGLYFDSQCVPPADIEKSLRSGRYVEDRRMSDYLRKCDFTSRSSGLNSRTKRSFADDVQLG